MSSDAPYWRLPSRALSMVFQTYGLEARFWLVSYLPTIRPVIPIRVRVLRQHRSKRALNSVPLQNSRE